jgi:hypothetical protein
MSSESPDVVIYDVNGNALAIQNGAAIPTNTPALMVAGSDGTNSRYITVDTSGRQIVIGYGAVTIADPGYSTGTSQPLSLSLNGGLRVGGGTAGAADANVVTVQGIASGTIIPVVANQGSANTLVNAWPYELTDGVNGPVAVKPASISAVATDAALVVTISPNSPLPAGSNVLGTVTVTGTNADGTTFTGNPVVAAGVDFNSLAQNISATNLNSLTHLNVIDLSTQNKLDMMILLLTDIRNLLLTQNASEGRASVPIITP